MRKLKVLYIYAAVLSLAFAGCKKEAPLEEYIPGSALQLQSGEIGDTTGLPEQDTIPPSAPLVPSQAPFQDSRHIGLNPYQSMFIPDGSIHSGQSENQSEWFPPGSIHSEYFESSSNWYPPESVHSGYFKSSSYWYPPGSVHDGNVGGISKWYPPGSWHSKDLGSNSEWFCCQGSSGNTNSGSTEITIDEGNGNIIIY